MVCLCTYAALYPLVLSSSPCSYQFVLFLLPPAALTSAFPFITVKWKQSTVRDYNNYTFSASVGRAEIIYVCCLRFALILQP